MSNILWQVVNLQKFFGMDNVEEAIAGFGNGMKAFYEKVLSVAVRIKSQLKYGIQFINCGNTITATHRKPSDLVSGSNN